MAIAIISVIVLGIAGAVGAKIGADHVYPWLLKHSDAAKAKAKEYREKYENRAKEVVDLEDDSK